MRSPCSTRCPPRPASEPILGRREWRAIAFTGLLQAVCTLAVFVWALEARGLEEARNLAFSVLVLLLSVVVLSVFVQLGIHHIPATQALFSIGALPLTDCVLSLLIGMIPLVVLEAGKVLRR